ncbi:MAG: hypothetical protein ABIA21_03665 [Candidatus Aenigmatarchaeota archaeon]
MKKGFVVIIILLATVVVSSGCINQVAVSSGGLDVRTSFDPQKIFSSASATFYVDIENADRFDYNDVDVNVFNTGILEMDDCSEYFDVIKPGEIKHLACTVTAPPAEELVQTTQTETVTTKVRFSKTITGIHNIEMITEDEYTRQSQTGKYYTRASQQSFFDSYLRTDLTFSGDFPLIDRPGTKTFMYIDITDVGSGIPDDLSEDDIEILEVQNKGIFDCDTPEVLTQIKNKFEPKISCTLTLPSDINYINDYTTIINIDYNYELRKTSTITIVR